MPQAESPTPEAPHTAVVVEPPLLGPRPDVTLHWALLAISTSVVLLALVLRVGGEEQVLLPLLNQPLPGTCTFKRYVGLDCPGCGLTRCFVSLAHGDVARAWSFNPMGMLLFAVVVFQVPYRLAQIWRVRRGWPEMGLGWWGYWSLLLIMAGLLIQWLIRVAGSVGQVS